MATVPNIVNMTAADAEAAIIAAGLTVGTVTEEYHDTVPAGTVISQAPSAGTTAAPGSAVSFVVSKGPEPVPLEVTQWPTASPITYGQALSASTLTGGTATVAGTFDFEYPHLTYSAGTHMVSVTFTPVDTINYFPISEDVSITVNKAPLSVTADNKSKTYDGQPFPYSSFTVSYLGFVPGEDASFLGGTLIFGGTAVGAVDPGTYTIIPSGLTSSNYDIFYANGTLTIDAKEIPEITTWPTASNIIYGQPLSDSTLTGGSASVDGAFTFVNPAALLNAGTHSVPVLFTPDDTDTYSTVLGTADVTVEKATPEVTAWPTASGITYGQPLSVSTLTGGTASVPGTFTFNVPGETPAVGIYPASVTFTPNDTDNYNTVSGTVNVAVAKAALTVTADNKSKTYDGAPFTDFTVSFLGFVLGENPSHLVGTLDFDGTAIGAVNAGTYTIVPSGFTSDNYEITYMNGTLTILMGTPEVTAWPAASNITYGQPLSSSTLTGGAASVPGTFVFVNPDTILDVGTHPAWVEFVPNDPNYMAVQELINITVEKATPEVTAWPTASDITYGQMLSASTLSGGTASVTGTFSFTLPTITPVAGTYTASVTFTPDDTDNYNTVTGSVQVQVDRARLDITADNKSKDYDGAPFTDFTVSYDGFVLAEGSGNLTGTLTFGGDAVGAVDVGTYTIIPSGLTSSNYEIFYANGTLAIYLGTPEVTEWPTASNITYGQPLSASTLTGGAASVPGTFVFDDPSAVLNAGTHMVAVNFVPTDSAYATVPGTVAITVNKATPDVTAWPTASAITYGQSLAASTLTGGTASVTGAFTFTVPTVTPVSGVYTAAVTFTPSDTGNYNTVAGTVPVTVNKAALTVQAEDKSKTYDGLPFTAFTASYSGFVLGDGPGSLGGTLTFSGTAMGAVDAGTYLISASGLTSDNYDISYETGTLTIYRAPLTVTADNKSKVYDGTPFTGFTASYAGLVSGQDASVLDGTLTFGGNAIDAVNANTYTITVSGLSSSNYDITFVNGTLTIQQADPGVTSWPTASAIVYGEPLSASTLTGGAAAMPGRFEFSTPAQILEGGTHSVNVWFIPDSDNYSTLSQSVSVTVMYYVEVSANPTEGGSVSGGGTYQKDEVIQVEATASEGYHFVNWTENGVEVSKDPVSTITVTANRNLVANFGEGELPPTLGYKSYLLIMGFILALIGAAVMLRRRFSVSH